MFSFVANTPQKRLLALGIDKAIHEYKELLNRFEKLTEEDSYITINRFKPLLKV